MRYTLIRRLLPSVAVGLALLRGMGELLVLQRWRLQDALRLPRRHPARSR